MTREIEKQKRLMQDIIAELQWRGLIYQMTDEATTLQKWLSQPRVVYAGFDPTADSLHVGSLLPLLMLRRFQLAGHRPIALAGGATGMIGDPSGKSEERQLLSSDVLQANIAGIRQQLSSLLEFENTAQPALLVNNIDWIGKFSYIEFLRDIGKNCSVNVMMSKDSVKNRLSSDVGLSYTEFSYMLLQAYDFAHLFQNHQCQLQVGGSDQWGNITAGIDLTRRMHSAQVFGMTCPLLTKSDGSKMGKTESGTVWLSAKRTSPYQFYQYWFNIADADVGKCLRFLTFLNREEIEALDLARQQEPNARASQKRLAEVMTLLIHGHSGLQAAENAAQILFGGEIENSSDQELLGIFGDVPSSSRPRADLNGGSLTLLDALVHSGLVKSKSEARRVVGEGGAYVNNRRQDNPDTVLTGEHLASESVMILRRGKRNYAVIRFDQ